ncbi:MAG: YihY/virulence factor BrkB family protein [Desulfomicrobium sp.]|nr:YihY/virulence factor BrkB family protein [Desulfomicrobium sp.]
MEYINKLLARGEDFVSRSIVHARREDTPAPWFVIRLLRTLLFAARDFHNRQGSLQASALTFYTLLSLVPVAAMAFGVAQGFGLEQLLEKELLRNFAAQQEVVLQVIAFARNLLNNTKGGLIAGIGVIVLFWSVTRVLGRIEHNFNRIWAVPSRSMSRKLSDYLAIMLIAPMFLIMSGSVTVFIASQVRAISSQVGMPGVLDPAVSLGLGFAPYLLLWTLFSLLYLIMPNTRVQVGGALLAGILAGSAYQLLQVSYIAFQINVASYNAIYGSFAALPLFLIWLQLSWHIVLFGAEIAHFFPHSDTVAAEPIWRERSMAQTRLLALAVCHEIVQRFHRDEPSISEEIIASEFDMSRSEASEMIDMLVNAHLLYRVQPDGDETPELHPARDSANITVRYVLDALDNAHANPSFPHDHPKLAAMSACLETLRKEFDPTTGTRLLRDIEPAQCLEAGNADVSMNN